MTKVRGEINNPWLVSDYKQAQKDRINTILVLFIAVVVLFCLLTASCVIHYKFKAMVNECESKTEMKCELVARAREF